MRSLFPLALPPLLFSPAQMAWAADASPGLSAGDIVQTFLCLGLILAILALLAWIGRTFIGKQGFGRGGMKILGVQALGPRERIILLEAGDQWLIIGIVPGQIRTLHTMPCGKLPEDNVSEKTSALPLFSGKSFSQWMQHFSKPRS